MNQRLKALLSKLSLAELQELAEKRIIEEREKEIEKKRTLLRAKEEKIRKLSREAENLRVQVVAVANLDGRDKRHQNNLEPSGLTIAQQIAVVIAAKRNKGLTSREIAEEIHWMRGNHLGSELRTLQGVQTQLSLRPEFGWVGQEGKSYLWGWESYRAPVIFDGIRLSRYVKEYRGLTNSRKRAKVLA